MDEKTIPLPRPGREPDSALKKPRNEWGEDFHYRALFEQTGECVFIVGLDLRYIAANQQALSLLGYQEDELIGMPVSEVMSLGEELGHGTISSDGLNLSERILKRKDGSTLPVEISASVVYDEENLPAYIQSIARDVSDRRDFEETLEKYTRILSMISDATARLLRSSNIEPKIPGILESLGMATDVSSCAILEIDTFSSTPGIDVRYRWGKQSSSAFDISSVIAPHIPMILSASGEYSNNAVVSDKRAPAFSGMSFIIMPIHGALGSWGFLGLFDEHKEISWSPSERNAVQTAANLIGSALQRSSYEETIQMSEARNRAILSALPDLLIRIDINGMILDYSANPDHPLYLHRDVISGKKLSETWPADVVEKFRGPANQSAFTSLNVVEGFRLPFIDKIYESRLYPISVGEALIVVRDITDQAVLNEMKSDFINRASHELRTPLTAAMLMTELIQGGGTPEELNEYWRTLRSELNRQKILIDRLLIAGRLESGMMTLEHLPVDLVPVLEDSLMAVKAIANKRKVALVLKTEQRPVFILGDKSGLQQVFINLINNAAKFSPEGTSVTVTVAQSEKEARVSISDQGLGIPPEARQHLFEKFYRARNVTIAEIPGSGIGLYIVKSIVDELGGSISVESALNRGTTFMISLLRAEPTSSV
ncbi:MAG TPA: ATP-binding protein [Anaerolineales bacterium]|nr:ATP-binding protein [Anaerolineales bacterium]